MYFESFRAGIVTLRVSQTKVVPNNSSNPWYVNTTDTMEQCLDDNNLVFSVSLAR